MTLIAFTAFALAIVAASFWFYGNIFADDE